MRLLSLTLSLLLISASSLASPLKAEPQKIIVTFVENVTRTVIHEVTDPTVPEVEEEGSGLVEEGSGEGSGLLEAEEEGSGEGSGLVEEVAIPDETGIVAASDAAKPCDCAPSTGSDSKTLTDETTASDTQITEISGQVKMCSCDVSNECRKEASKGMETCMDECKSEFESFGDKTEEYLKCFTKNKAAIVEAEECLFKNLTDSCTANGESKFVNQTNWDELTSGSYSSEAQNDIKENFFWKRDESKYNTMQNFFHCTKNCMHKKLQQCTKDKGCAVRMPEREQFHSTMKQCIKKNHKIATSILSTCQCLAWTKGVKNLQGSCIVIGNQYYIDRA